MRINERKKKEVWKIGRSVGGRKCGKQKGLFTKAGEKEKKMKEEIGAENGKRCKGRRWDKRKKREMKGRGGSHVPKMDGLRKPERKKKR